MATANTSVDAAKASAMSYGQDALNSQKELLANAMRLNTAMAWYQLAIALAGKITGR